ncbi:hypothetical protein [Mesorhizobium sp. M0701]|uniref:hypothetical protein n=1 Tax=Mesorhizobium sp. M0701 TaxID=2956989 RepID=UPI003336579A
MQRMPLSVLDSRNYRQDQKWREGVNDIDRLKAASKELVDAINFDDNGAMVGGKWMGGNGGLLSRETLQKADAVRRALNALAEQVA